MRLFVLAAHLGDCHADTATGVEYMAGPPYGADRLSAAHFSRGL